MIVGTTALIAGFAASSGDSGIPAWLGLRGDLARAEARVHQLEGQVAALDRERAALDEDSPFALERAIREELGLARAGEVVVLWPEAGQPLAPERVEARGRRADTDPAITARRRELRP